MTATAMSMAACVTTTTTYAMNDVRHFGGGDAMVTLWRRVALAAMAAIVATAWRKQ